MIRAMLFALLLSGCSSLAMVQAAPPPQTVTVTWLRVPAPVLCRGLKAEACTASNGHECLIAMPADAVAWVKAEELDHCFGAQHREFLK